MLPDKVEEALHIRDGDTMEDLIQKMYRLERFYSENEEYNGFQPFIKVYREVTEDVNELYGQGAFNDPSTMEQLDLYFAGRYLEPMRAFLLHGEKQRPWSTYIDYCTREDRYESLAMFLGINAHINGDLLHAVNHIGLEDQHDYNRINGILEQHLSHNLHYLILKEHDRLALYAELVKPLTWYEMHTTIIRWRQDIWQYRGQDSHQVETVFEDATEQIADRLIDIAHNTSLLTLPIESWRLHNIQIGQFDTIAQRLPPT